MIELSELLRELRAELNEAVAAAPASGLRFEMGPVEMEVSVAVEKSASGGTKVKFWVIELGPEAGIARTSVQRVKLTLIPRASDTGAAPFVAGREEPGER